MPMTPLSYTQIDDKNFTEVVAGRAEVRALEDWTGKVPHAEGGRAGKFSFFPRPGPRGRCLSWGGMDFIPQIRALTRSGNLPKILTPLRRRAFLEAVDEAGSPPA